MPLPVFKTLEEIPEAFRPEYEQVENEWRPKAARTDDDVTKTKAALDREREQRKAEEKARKDAERERDELKRKADAADKGITEEQLNALRAEDEKKRKPIEDENTTLKDRIRKLTLTDRVQSMALKSGVMPDRIEDAMLVLDRRTKLTDDGESIVVLDKAKNPTTEKVEEFLAKTFKTEKPWLYAGSGANGGGGEGSNGGGQSDAEVLKRVTAEKQAMVRGAF